MGVGDHDWLEIYSDDNGYHSCVPLRYAVDGDDLVINVRPGQTVRLTDQMIKSNVNGANKIVVAGCSGKIGHDPPIPTRQDVR